MVRLTAVLLLCAAAGDAAPTPEPTPAPTAAATPAPTPAPTEAAAAPNQTAQFLEGKTLHGRTSADRAIYKLDGSAKKGCDKAGDIYIGQTFKAGLSLDASQAITACADDCESFYSAQYPKLKCTGFEVADINDAVGLSGIQCSLWKGPCALKDEGGSEEIRGQYALKPKLPPLAAAVAAVKGMSVMQFRAGTAFLVLLLFLVYFMCCRSAPKKAAGAKRGVAKKVAAVVEEVEEEVPMLNPYMMNQGMMMPGSMGSLGGYPPMGGMGGMPMGGMGGYPMGGMMMGPSRV